MRPTSAHPLISVVIPIYNEEEVLPELFTRLTGVFNAQTDAVWQAVFVNDGSRDRSAELVRTQAAADPRFELVELSRNFGFQAALAAGLAQARGDAVVTMDADLQDPPECIPAMVAAWRNGAEVVQAVRRSRQETGLRRLGMDFFHRTFSRISDFPITSNTGTFGLMDRVAVDALNCLPERNRFFPGLRSWVGFTTTEILYDRQERAAGRPQQTFRRLLRYATDGVFSFSYLPLRLLTYTGTCVSLLGFIVGMFFIVRRLLGIEVAQTGFTTLVTLVLFLGGVQLIGIGVLGEYLGRIYDEVKQRPTYIVRRKP
ncbi:MAG: glycosyltransferase family 2 protein [Opitutae bacterium]|nr:glycosyltransferase family 2 protein [Opitutae bacterium]